MIGFINDEAALNYLKTWAIDDGFTRIGHDQHLMIEKAYEQVSEQLFRINDLDNS